MNDMNVATRATTHDLMDMVAELLVKHGCAGSASDVLAAKRFIPDVPVTDVLVEGR